MNDIFILISIYLVNLFINSVSTQWILVLFDNDRNIISEKHIQVLMNESSSLLWFIDKFLVDNNFSYQDIQNIVVVHWPGSFTGIRTVSLIVNSIAFAFKDLLITPVSFFDLLDSYPLIKSSSKRDLFVKKGKADKIEIVKNDDFIVYLQEEKIDKVYWDVAIDFLWDIPIDFSVDYKKIIADIEFDTQKEISPLYLKKPNIT